MEFRVPALDALTDKIMPLNLTLNPVQSILVISERILIEIALSDKCPENRTNIFNLNHPIFLLSFCATNPRNPLEINPETVLIKIKFNFLSSPSSRSSTFEHYWFIFLD